LGSGGLALTIFGILIAALGAAILVRGFATKEEPKPPLAPLPELKASSSP